MIKANELRIGNWVVFGGMYRKVSAIVPPKIQVEYSILSLTDVEPISLTPEVLEKCGFKKEDKEYDFWKLYFAEIDTQYPSSLLWGLGNKYVQVCRNFTGAASPPTEHLHQLQNLYFALTQTELEYKP